MGENYAGLLLGKMPVAMIQQDGLAHGKNSFVKDR